MGRKCSKICPQPPRSPQPQTRDYCTDLAKKILPVPPHPSGKDKPLGGEGGKH